MKQVEKVLHAAQASACAPALPLVDDMPELVENNDNVVLDDKEEDDVVITLDEPERMAPNQRERIIRQRTQEQLASRKIKVGYHHGKLNPLPASWRYPPGLTLIQLCHLWPVGSPRENVPALRKMRPALLPTLINMVGPGLR